MRPVRICCVHQIVPLKNRIGSGAESIEHRARQWHQLQRAREQDQRETREKQLGNFGSSVRPKDEPTHAYPCARAEERPIRPWIDGAEGEGSPSHREHN